MIDINEVIRETHKPLSLERIRARFRYPNWYHAASISDFLKDKEHIKPTPNKMFLIDKFYSQKALIYLSNCRYEQHSQPQPEEELTWLWQMDLRYLRLAEKIGILDSETGHRERLNELVNRYNNATLSDPTGKIDVYSSHQIPSGTRLSMARLTYYPIEEMIYLDNYRLQGPSETEKSGDSMLDKLARLIPKISPA